jgi:hypothetical protein
MQKGTISARSKAVVHHQDHGIPEAIRSDVTVMRDRLRPTPHDRSLTEKAGLGSV